jgi:hypothetical protein
MPQTAIWLAVKAAAAAWAKWAAAHWIAAAIIKLAVTVATSYAIGRVMGRSLKSGIISNGNPLELTRDPLTPRRVLWGQRRAGGDIKFAHRVNTGGVDYLYLIIIWCAHRSQSIDEIKFADEVVPLDGAGNATGNYAGLVRITHHLGTYNQAADANFVAELGGVFTVNDRWQGCTYSAVRMKWDDKKFPTGMPAITATGRWRIPYDPRDGTQDPAIESTWKYTNNAFVCLYDYCRGVPFPDGTGALVRLFGVNAGDDEIEQPHAIAAMNVADEDVPRGTGFSRSCSVLTANRHINTANVTGIIPGMPVTGGVLAVGTIVVSVDESGIYFTVDRDPTGTNAAIMLTFGDTEKRYTINGGYDLDVIPSQVIDNFLLATGGKLHDVSGDLVMRAGAWEEPDVTLGQTALRGDVGVTAPLSFFEKLNVVRGVFTNPAESYVRTDFPPVASNTLITADQAQLPGDLDVSAFVTSSAQAQRLAKMKMLRTRQGQMLSLPCNLRAAQLMTGENFRFTFAPLGYAAKAFELHEFTLSIERDKNKRSGFVIDLTAQETDSSIFDWTTSEEQAVDPAPNTNLPDPRTVPVPTGLALTSGAATVLVQPTDGTVIPRLKFSWTLATDSFVRAGKVRLEYSVNGSGVWTHFRDVPGSLSSYLIDGVQAGTHYDGRIAFINNLGVVGDYCAAVVNHTLVGDNATPATPTDLTASVGTGKLVALTWTEAPNEPGAQYGIYRSTANNSAGAVLIAKVTATRIEDIGVTLGTGYFYWRTTFDASGNESLKYPGQFAGVSATPAFVDGTSIDHTVGADPTAATKTSQGVYQNTSDGRTEAFMAFSVPAKPSWSVGQKFVMRDDSDTQWVEVGTYTNTATMTDLKVRGLTPGRNYRFGTEAYNLAGDFSNIVQVAGGPFLAPGDTTGPNAPSGFSVIAGNSSGASITPRTAGSPPIQLYACRVTFLQSTSDDLWFYECQGTVSDTDGAASIVCDVNGSEYPVDAGKNYFDYWAQANTTLYLRVRGVDYSGNRGAWARVGEISASLQFPSGNLLLQNNNNVQISAVKTGDTAAASVRQVRTRYPFADRVASLAGGAPTETFTLDVSNRGFVTVPDVANVQVIDPAGDLEVSYNWANGSNSSSTIYLTAYTKDGTAITGGLRRFGGEVVEYN